MRAQFEFMSHPCLGPHDEPEHPLSPDPSYEGPLQTTGSEILAARREKMHRIRDKGESPFAQTILGKKEDDEEQETFEEARTHQERDDRHRQDHDQHCHDGRGHRSHLRPEPRHAQGALYVVSRGCAESKTQVQKIMEKSSQERDGRREVYVQGHHLGKGQEGAEQVRTFAEETGGAEQALGRVHLLSCRESQRSEEMMQDKTMVLVQYYSNWADEFDVSGFRVMSKEQWEKHLSDVETFFKKLFAAPLPEPEKEYSSKNREARQVEVYFGTNEAMLYESFDDYKGCFTVKEITNSDHDVLKRLFKEHRDERLQVGTVVMIDSESYTVPEVS